MKSKFHLKMLTMLLLSFFFPLISFAQSRDTTWSVHGNHIDSCGRLGSNNYKDVKIVTDSVTRMLISKDGYIQIQNDLLVPNGSISTDTIVGVEGGNVNVNTNLNVTGYVKADSIIGTSGNINLNGNLNLPNNWIHADSLRCRVIHVGDSSITIGGQGIGQTNTIATTGPVVGTSSASTLAIKPANGITYFPTSGNVTPAYPKIGIGTNTPQSSLHLYMPNTSLGATQPVYELFTNSVNEGNTNGLQIGIAADGNAELRQNQALPMNFFTSGTQQMTITSDGKVGIGITAPRDVLHLNRDNTDGVGIRLTNASSGVSGLVMAVEGGTGNAQLIQFSDKPMYFYTNGLTTPRMTILGGGNIGINQLTPTNTLEINNGTGGNSGLTFTQLTSSSTLATNPGSGVLTVDAGGKVILVNGAPAVSGAQNGTTVISGKVELGTALLHDTDIPLAGGQLTFSDMPANHVITINQNGIYYSNTGPGTVGGGIWSDIEGADPAGEAAISATINSTLHSSGNTAFYGWAYGTYPPGVNPNQTNYGVNVMANDANYENYGVYGETDNNLNPAYTTNYGVAGIIGTGGGNNTGYAVYGNASTSPANSWAGYFVGYTYTPGAVWHASDSILKHSISNVCNPIGIVRQLKPKQYYFDTSRYSFLNLPVEKQYGFLAEDLQGVLPDLVRSVRENAKFDTSGTMIHDSLVFKAVSPEGITSILVGAVKQLDSLQHALPKLNNGLSADTTTHMMQWGGSPLKHNTVIPMVDTTGGIDSARNVYFSGQEHNNEYPIQGRIGIGYNLGDDLQGKLSVQDSMNLDYYNDGYAGLFYVTGISPMNHGFYAGIEATSDVSTEPNNNTNVGGQFNALNAPSNYGVMANATGSSDFSGGAVGVSSLAVYGYYSCAFQGSAAAATENYGASLYAGEGSAINIGLYALVSPVSEASNIAVYGDIGSSGSTAPDYAGYFNGDVYTTGSYLPSDSKLKTNIQELTGASALKTIDALQPKTYNYNAQQFPSMALSTNQQYGLISEDVEKTLPTLVKDSKTPPKVDSLGKIISPSIEFKALNYTGLIPILIAATKQLDSTNQAQQTKIDSLQSQLAKMNTAIQQLQNCCQQNSSSAQQGNREEVSLSNSNAIILDQNAPNPFAEQTTITYTIPETVGNAQIIFSDINGDVIKTVQIQTRGEGSLLVYASNLSSGIYIYSLIADGKLIDTKKMTVQK